MRTTIDLDLDILTAARDLAAVRGTTIGKTVSELVRKALTMAAAAPSGRSRNGVSLMPRLAAGAPALTMSAVNALRDE